MNASHVLLPSLRVILNAVALFASLAATRAEPIRIMPVGDSITRGLANSGPIPGGYRTKLHNRLKTELFAAAGVDFVGSQNDNPDPGNLTDPDHEGRGGWRIDQHESTIDAAILTYVPAVVLLHLGTNDVAQDYALADAPARLNQLITTIVTRSPGTRVIVAQIISSTNSGENSQIQAFNAAIPAIVSAHQSAGHHVSLVTMASVISPGNMADVYHPNNAGYDQLADAWFPAISSLGPISNPTLPAQPGDSIVRTNAVLTGTETGFPASGADLIATGRDTLSAATHSAYTPFTTGTGTTSPATLNDGMLGAAAANANTAFDLDGQWASTYSLNRGIAPWGYEIEEIRTIAGWQESRTSQTYELFFAFVANPNVFVSHGIFSHSVGTSVTGTSTRITLTDPTGIIASGVVAVRFDIRSPGGGLETVYREIDVLGKPTLVAPKVLIGVADGTVSLAMDALVTGSTVTVQRSPILNASVWQEVSSFTATSSQSVWSGPIPLNEPKNFYRIKVSQ